MIEVANPRDCSGCTACASVCGHKAITMEPDKLGFLYPKVDADKCVECGLCEKICPFLPQYDTSDNLTAPDIYAGRLKDEELLSESQSGGAFTAFATLILNRGGVVYGAAFTDCFGVAHRRIDSIEELEELKGSKYVQSDLSDTLLAIRKDLVAGKEVLFSGTPCQTAGVNAFIPQRLKEHLYLIDVVCHGVPAPFIWRDYVSLIQKQNEDELLKVKFRDKSVTGWHGHKESFVFRGKGRQIYTDYTFLFYQHNNLRESCYNCHFCNLRRPSDISICDFWGCQKVDAVLDGDNKGVSVFICNTPKGEKLFAQIQDRVRTFKVTSEQIMQPNMQHPSWRSKDRDAFEEDYDAHGLEYVIKKYGQNSMRNKLRRVKKKIIYAPIVFAAKIKHMLIKK